MDPEKSPCALPESKSLLLFDGACPMCAKAAAWTSKRSRTGRLVVAPLQDYVAEPFLQRLGPDAMRSIVLLDKGACFRESSAALRVCLHLRGGWPLLALFLAIPRPVRDAVYRWVARRRATLSCRTCPISGVEEVQNSAG